MTTEQLSMSMFANRADYDAAVRAQAETLPEGLQLAIQYCNIGTTQDKRNFAEGAIRAEHQQRVKAERALIAAGYTDNGGELWKPPLGPSASPLLERIAELEAEAQEARDMLNRTLTRMSAAEMRGHELEAERDEMRARLGAAAEQEPDSYRKDYPIREQDLGREIEKARQDEKMLGVGFTVNGWHVPAHLVSRWGAVPAQAAPEGWRLVLTEARDLFTMYAESHRARGPEHAEKAARNEAMAAKINAALAASPEAAR